jgi:hypothetical protein
MYEPRYELFYLHTVYVNTYIDYETLSCPEGQLRTRTYVARAVQTDSLVTSAV